MGRGECNPHGCIDPAQCQPSGAWEPRHCEEEARDTRHRRQWPGFDGTSQYPVKVVCGKRKPGWAPRCCGVVFSSGGAGWRGGVAGRGRVQLARRSLNSYFHHHHHHHHRQSRSRTHAFSGHTPNPCSGVARVGCSVVMGDNC